MNAGIFLGFEPKENNVGETSRYEVWLINNTQRQIIYTIKFELKTGQRKSINGKLDDQKAESIGILQKDNLNDAPSYNIDCRAITTEGTGERQHKLLKIKAQQFFKKQGILPVLNVTGHGYEVFPQLGHQATRQKGNSLKTYAKTHFKKKPPETQLGESLYSLYNIEERASFQTEIDLHIEQLTSNYSKLSNSEILALQMRHFKEFMANAIRIGVDEVYIVHGKGSGRLRNLIWQALDDYPEVEGKEGGYHEGYEFGATRVFF